MKHVTGDFETCVSVHVRARVGVRTYRGQVKPEGGGGGER